MSEKKSLMDAFKTLNTTPEALEAAVQLAIKELKCSRKRAMSELLMFFVSHGDIENFKDIINFFVSNQEEFTKER